VLGGDGQDGVRARLPPAASAAPARRKPSIVAPGACTTKAAAPAPDSLRMVCGVPPASGTTAPAAAVQRHTLPSGSSA
jgi:hypothetical protein